MAPCVLIVEDDRGNRDLLSLMLREEGYRVALTADGQEALAAVTADPPDVIILDLIMPVMNGWEFARQYLDRPAPRAPIIVLSATGDTDVPGAIASLTKPFDLEDLLICLDGVTGRRPVFPDRPSRRGRVAEPDSPRKGDATDGGPPSVQLIELPG